MANACPVRPQLAGRDALLPDEHAFLAGDAFLANLFALVANDGVLTAIDLWPFASLGIDVPGCLGDRRIVRPRDPFEVGDPERLIDSDRSPLGKKCGRNSRWQP